ncbi:MAG: hypothetical protein ACFCVK_11450 [Acidimicrobiales bacterium]
MLIALIVTGVVAVAFAAMFLLTKGSAGEFRAQAEARESALIAERDQLRASLAERDREVESTRSDLTAAGNETVVLKGELTTSANEIRRLGSQIIERDATIATRAADVAERDERLAGRAREIAALNADIAALNGDIDGLRSQLEAAERRAGDAEAALAAAREAGIVIGDTVDAGHPAALWDLEVARSERTWRTSVALDPSADSPFETTDDPVRLAVEIEAAALRENVGSAIVVDWEAAAVADPGRRHLIVRVAQELLETAARSPEPARLVASGDEEITLRLVSGEGDEVLSMIPPHVVNDLIDVRAGAGLSITVKAE